MNPMVYVLLFILVTAGGIIIMSFLLSLIITVASSRFAEKTVTKFHNELLAMLPGKDCGECGFKNCADYAQAFLCAEASEFACSYGSADLSEKLNGCLARFRAVAEDPTPIGRKKK